MISHLPNLSKMCANHFDQGFDGSTVSFFLYISEIASFWLVARQIKIIRCRVMFMTTSQHYTQENNCQKYFPDHDDVIKHSKNKVVKWTTLGLSNWCQKRTPQSRPKLVILMSRRMTTLISSQKQPESRQMTTFFTGFSAIWRLSYHLRTTEWQTSNRQMMVLWLICDTL